MGAGRETNLSLRATFLLLLLANLVFFAWAALIDVAPEPPQSDSISGLPRLQLLSEVRARQPATPPASARTAGASTVTGSASVKGGASDTPAATNGAAAASAVHDPAASGDPAAIPAGAVSADRCVTVGPFSDVQRASEATALLRQRGFRPRPRVEATQQQGYWVYVGGFKSQAAETSAVRRLERNGVTDAKIMPASGDEGRRVSVGLFTRRDDAERRGRAVRSLGFNVQIEEQPPAGTARWIDVNLASSAQALPTESLLSLEEGGSRLEIAECPSDAQPSAVEEQPTEAGSTAEKAGTLAAPRAAPTSRPVLSKPLTAQGSPQPG